MLCWMGAVLGPVRGVLLWVGAVSKGGAGLPWTRTPSTSTGKETDSKKSKNIYIIYIKII